MATILLVDDNQAFLKMYGKLLELIGFDMVLADGEEECMHTLLSVHPDLVLLDIMMEPRDDWEILQSISHNLSTKDLPVVILTGKRPTVEEIDRYGGDIDDYIMKPVRKDEIKKILERVLEKIRKKTDEKEKALGRGCNPSDISEYFRLARAIDMDDKFNELFVEIRDEQKERVRQRRNQRDVLSCRLNNA